MAAPARRKSIIQSYLLIAGLLTILGTLMLWYAVSQHHDWRHWLGCWLLVINVVAFGYYGFDKRQARAGRRRVPEAVLHTLAAAGGSVGAFAGMKCFRHKTIKGKFQIVFWCIVVLQVLIALWIVKTLWWT
jgi:uncharacterized membrane protein YsdA (DUF1294 family)